jgi:hypothetical protein
MSHLKKDLENEPETSSLCSNKKRNELIATWKIAFQQRSELRCPEFYRMFETQFAAANQGTAVWETRCVTVFIAMS